MYLAGILALWALLHPPVRGGVGSVRSPMAVAIAHTIRQLAQEPAKPAPPAEPAQAKEPPAQQPEQAERPHGLGADPELALGLRDLCG